VPREVWRQCAHWLVAARVLPAGHRASSPGGQVWDLAQALRDGVLLCHLLNALLPRAVPSRDICPRPQMSQFLCLRNIRTFLTACADKFGLPKHRLFGAFDLFDVQDFGKVIETLSTLSWTPIAQSKGFTPFPSEDSVGDDDVYSGLSDLIDDTAEEDDDLYDCVEAEGDDGDDIYEDLMRVERPPATVGVTPQGAGTPPGHLCPPSPGHPCQPPRPSPYTETLESICQHFLRPLRHFLSPRDMESIFINVEVTVTSGHGDTGTPVTPGTLTSNTSNTSNTDHWLDLDGFWVDFEWILGGFQVDLGCPSQVPLLLPLLQPGGFWVDLGQFWVDCCEFGWILGGFGWIWGVHPRFLLYGRYCSQVEAAARRLDQLSTCTDLRMKLQECSQRANNGRFSLRDLLMVPMQRVLKYHLLLQNVHPLPMSRSRCPIPNVHPTPVSRSWCPIPDVPFPMSIPFPCPVPGVPFPMSHPVPVSRSQPQSLAQFGRPKIDGELKVSSTERRSKVDRYGFLLDKALIICKRRGDSYETKDVVDLQSHQLRDGGLGPRDGKKWSHTFMLLDTAGLQDYELFFKTRELKKKWLEQFEMALSNIFPEHALADGHEFQMFSFEDTTSCRACQMLLRGTLYQGSRCSRCRAPAHKECLGRVGTCGKAGTDPASGSPHTPQPPPNHPQGHPITPRTPQILPYGHPITLRRPKILPQPFQEPQIPSQGHPITPRTPQIHIKVTASEGLYRVTEKKAFKGLVVRARPQKLLGGHPRNPGKPKSFLRVTPCAIRSFGSAKARYDFSARDRTELSLREGDIVRVLSKK
ncbi:PREDICTED: proto-oncogene vav, partial [Corvus brachyrhynchos]|uniref:proto-oncogene vav n=1 Tax=Corvus brachyrhynchos TaxID=85066 RepID=UPI00081643DE